MSTYKPLSEQIAGRMIMDIKNGTSVFQRPNNSLNSALPFNIESGHKYAGPSALVLLMQKRDDPRWGTSNQANRNHTAVLKGATGTLINFMTQFEYQKVVDEKGEPVLKENGKQRTERVKLDEPKQVDAWMFNGEQMRNMPKWEKEPMELSPAERAQVILENSKAVIEQGGDDMYYDRDLGAIIIPEKEQFASPEQYYAEALHQLAHQTYQTEGLNRDGDLHAGEMVSEELRTNLASLFLSKELNLPYDLNEHVGYLNSWSVLLKEEPGELFKAASDAQKIV
ncbi:MAG: zincin-like metallopeptidase domain-containing protein, partial [Negativicutes bacterium]|nr:zincin-like metallopeptidase domain-containing protein [Negativicutes bacterium]